MAELGMPFLDEYLSLWNISFRWAGLDPDSLKYRFYLPTVVKDNIRLLTQAIITNVLFCKSLKPDDLLAPDTEIDHNRSNKFYGCYTGTNYDRDFLNSHTIYRSDFAHWCNRQGIPFPEFWFPTGWVVHELNEKDWLAETDTRTPETTVLVTKEKSSQKPSGKRVQAKDEIWEPAKIAAQTIWSQNESLAIAEVIRMIKDMPELKASIFTEPAIRKHIAKLSPTPGKSGRKSARKLI